MRKELQYIKSSITSLQERLLDDVVNFCEEDCLREAKYVCFVLDEAKTNIDNNKYFNINFDKYCDFLFYEIKEGIYVDFQKLNNEIKIMFKNIVLVYFENRKVLNAEALYFIDELENENPDLYGEMINYILNGDKFENKLIEIDNTNAKKIMDETKCSLMLAYEEMFDRYRKLKKEEKKYEISNV